MGRRSNRSRSREFAGCISGVLHNLFDFNQGFSARKFLVQDATLREGLEAPRNSLDIHVSGGIVEELRRMSEANISDIPFGRWEEGDEGEDGPLTLVKKRVLTTHVEAQSPRTPSVVARLMGLEPMPDNDKHSSSASTPTSLSRSKQFFCISMDKEKHKHKKEKNVSKIQSTSFKLEELEALQPCRHSSEAEMPKRDQLLRKSNYKESAKARSTGRETVESSRKVVYKDLMLSTVNSQHTVAKPPFCDEVAPFRDININATDSTTPSPRVTRHSSASNLPLKCLKENVYSVRFSKDAINPREIARKMIKQAKEKNACKASTQICANQNHDLACSCSPSSASPSYRRRNLQGGIETGTEAVEVESSSRLLSSKSSGKSSPRQLISPRLNKSMEQISYKDDGSTSGSGLFQTKSNSPRLTLSSQSKSGSKTQRFHGSTCDFPTTSSTSQSLPLHTRTDGRTYAITSHNYCISKGRTTAVPATMMKKKKSAINGRLLTDNVAFRDKATQQVIGSCTMRRPQQSPNPFFCPSISSPSPSPTRRRSQEFAFDKRKKIPQPISEDFSSVRGNGDGEAGCDIPSPDSVLDALSREETPSPLRLQEFTTKLQRLEVENSDKEKNVLNESLREEDIMCSDERKSELVYVKNILCCAGFRSESIVTFTRWYSPAHPINPDIYHQLDKCYGAVKPSLSQRKLIFELVDEILSRKVKPLLNMRPWINPNKQSQRYVVTGKELLQQLWSEICSFPQADCKILEDIDALVKMDLANVGESTATDEENVEKIGFEVEQHIFNCLVEEAVADLLSAL